MSRSPDAPPSLLHIVDQDYIAAYRSPCQEQLLAGTRPGEIEDGAVSEVCDLLGWAANERLAPDVGNAVLVVHVQHCFAIWRPAERGIYPVGQLGWSAAFDGHNGEFKSVCGLLKGVKGNPLSVGGHHRA